jgi:pyruvate/2-oxoglutarate dehydrogenase complex dihydrolipoamide dehydrogenase (E3) component
MPGATYVDQAEQELHHVVVAVDRLRRGRPPHAGQVGVDAPVAAPVGEHRLEAAGDLAVIHARSVQGEHGRPVAVVDEVHRDAVDGGLHDWALLPKVEGGRLPRQRSYACRRADPATGGSAVFDVIVLGGGPAGVAAALRTRELGATVALVERDRLGGVCTNDGCVPTRVLAKAARLVRDTEQFGDYGLSGARPVVDFRRLLDKAAATVERIHQMKGLPERLQEAGVHLVTGTGGARFADAHTIVLGDGHGELRAEQVIVCVGGHARRLPFPGSELALTHSDIWALGALPGSVVVVGGSATGCQLASVLDAFGSEVTLLEAADRLLGAEDEAISDAVADAFRRRGIEVVTGVGPIERLERAGGGLRLHHEQHGETRVRQVEAVLLAVGWPGNLDGLGLDAAGIRTDGGHIAVDDRLRSSAPNVYAAGDVIGHLLRVQPAAAAARVAAQNALAERAAGSGDLGVPEPWPLQVVPRGGFTDPEYSSVGLSEAAARTVPGGCVVATVPYADLERAVIDRHGEGFAKLLVSRSTRQILGAHVVGEQAVEVVQLAAASMAAEQPVEQLAGLELAYPTFTAIVGLAAREAIRQLS